MEGRAPAYRWVIEALIIVGVLSQNMTWLAPAPLLGRLMKDLDISLGAAGLIISIIALCIAVFSLFGAIVADRIGPLRAMLVGAWLLAGGGILSGHTHGFAALLACRIVEGVGFGFMIAPQGTLVMQWFPPNELPYVNMLNGLCFYAAMAVVFRVTVPIFLAVGSSWRAVFADYGVGVAAVALAWTILGRSRGAQARHQASSAASEAAPLAEALRDRNIVISAVGFFGVLWVVQLYTAFLPEYFRLYRGLSLSEASTLTGLLPLTGIFAAAAGGIGTGLVKLRRPFLWPVASLTIFGCIGAVMAPSVRMIGLSLVVVGIGTAGLFSPAVTLQMELPGMTPAKMGATQALTFACGYMGAFISPFLGGYLAQFFGLRAVMLGLLIFQLEAVVCLYLLPETGPGRRQADVDERSQKFGLH